MPQDEELEALVRARRTAPDDPALALRHALALARAGDEPGAERLLVAALDDAPGDADLTATLDRLTGGRLRGAAWPSSAGDARRTRRSLAVGPSRGEVVLRRELFVDSPIQSIAVGRDGAGYVLTWHHLYSIDREGDVLPLAAVSRDLGLEDVVLLPAGRILLVGRRNSLTLFPRDGSQHRGAPSGRPELARVHRTFSYSSKFAVGASGLLYSAASRNGRVDAHRLIVPSEPVTVCRTEHDKTGLAIAPGGDLIVAIEGSQRKYRTARLLRLDPLGEATRFDVDLNEREFGKTLYGPIVDRDGNVFMGFPGLENFARDVKGEKVWEVPYTGEPFALAGPDARFLVARQDRSLHLLDARTGAERAAWSGAFYQGIAVDARGWIYARRGDDLVAYDPEKPKVPALEVEGVAQRSWDFVLAGGGRIYAFPKLGSGAGFVVIE